MKHKQGVYEKLIKRLQDIILSLVAMLILSPVYLVVALVVRIKLGSPVIFSQNRPGLNGKIFKMYKFRSMTNQKDKIGNLLSDEERLTKTGKRIRAMSLDELPEFWNILRGDMSIVGPRPLLVEYMERYDDHQARRHEVRSGLTGLAQVNGRNAISWEEKFNLDVKYVDNISFLMDWKIIFLTIKKVFIREGINSDRATTMEPFKGNKQE
jgi:lipopolysaccharide/colanic/teichoic acid biosynthesis glycosyltransferase